MREEVAVVPDEVVSGELMRDLEVLADVVEREHAEAEALLESWLDRAVEIGRALMEARPQVPLGKWGSWCADRGMTHGTISIYWRCAEYEEALRSAGAVTRTSARRFLAASELRTSRRYERVDPQVKARAIALVESGISMNEAAKLVGVSSPTVQMWINPEAAERKRRKERARKIARASSREAEFRRQTDAAAKAAGGDLEKAYEYTTKLDAVLGRAREQATDRDVRVAIEEAHKHRDRSMQAILRALGVR